MANSKISALTSATTPLAGTETLPVVQSGATTKVTVANLTAGRAVSASSVTTTGAIQASGNFVSASSGVFLKDVNSSFLRIIGGTVGNVDPTITLYGSTNANSNLATYDASSHRLRDVSGTTFLNVGTDTTNYGNFVQGTAAKGINFTANTPAAGMTSQLLNWYEEGTWTPNQGAGLTLVGAFSSTGKYIRIGRQVSVSGTVTGATSVAVAAAGVVTSNLPFTVGTEGHGDATNTAVNASAAVICTSTSVTSAGGLLATGTITFSATYFV